MRRLTTNLSLFVALGTPLLGQVPHELVRLSGAATNTEFAISMSATGDVSGDGVPDYLIGESRFSPLAVPNGGRALLYSGADGSVLYAPEGEFPNLGLGKVVAGVGDATGDGTPDFVLAAPLFGGSPTVPQWPPSAGLLQLYSGADGTRVGSFVGQADERLGTAIRAAGDVDADGRADILVYGPTGDGYLRIMSGADLSTLFQFDGWAGMQVDEHAFDGLGDIDGDGHADFILGHSTTGFDGLSDVGFVRVYSGADFSTLYEPRGNDRFQYFGASVAGVGDVDFDLVPDFAVQSRPTGSWRVDLFSGATGNLIRPVWTQAAGLGIEPGIRAAGDLDGDGAGDILVQEWPAMSSRTISAYSGAHGGLLARIEGDYAEFSTVGDIDGNGTDEFLIGSGSIATNRNAKLLTVGAFVTDHGVACPDARGTLPGISVPMRPAIGQPFRVDGADVDPAASAVWLYGVPQDPAIDLTLIGAAPGCALLVNPFFADAAISQGGENVSSITVGIPLDPGLVGFVTQSQWVLVDPALHISVSAAARLHFGY